MEESLEDWLKDHNLYKRYQLEVTDDHVILLEIDSNHIRTKAIQQRNGVPVEQIAREYSESLNAPVKIIE